MSARSKNRRKTATPVRAAQAKRASRAQPPAPPPTRKELRETLDQDGKLKREGVVPTAETIVTASRQRKARRPKTQQKALARLPGPRMGTVRFLSDGGLFRPLCGGITVPLAPARRNLSPPSQPAATTELNSYLGVHGPGIVAWSRDVRLGHGGMRPRAG